MAQSSHRLTLVVAVTTIVLLSCSIVLIHHAWKNSKIGEASKTIQSQVQGSQVISLLNIQIEQAKLRVRDLDPGPPPPWFYPSYYYEWLPKERLYEEAQDVMLTLQAQRLQLIEHRSSSVSAAKKTWNFGIAPVLHFLLAIALITITLRVLLRYALWSEWFSWQQIEK